MNLHVHIWDYRVDENEPIREIDVPVSEVYEDRDENDRPTGEGYVQFSFTYQGDDQRPIEIRVPIDWLTLKAYREASE